MPDLSPPRARFPAGDRRTPATARVTPLTLAVALVGLVASARPGFAEWPGAPAGAADAATIRLDRIPGVTLAVDTSRYRVTGTGSPSGLSWNLSRGTTLFGEYRLIQRSGEPFAPFGAPRSSADADAGARDLMYGISVRF